MGVRQIQQAPGPLDVALSAPASKSVTHRALVAAALASGQSAILDPLDADDTRVTLEGLRALGLAVSVEPARWRIEGCAGNVPGGGRLRLAESGTSMRFLLALAAAGASPSRLDGSTRLRERPIGKLVRALAGLGGQIRPETERGGLPVTAGGAPLHGGVVVLDARESSQYASALLLIGSRLEGGIDLRLQPGAVSTPYVDLTAEVLRAFGAKIRRRGRLRWIVEHGDTRGTAYRVEGDHSSASYFLAAPAIVGGTVRVDRLRRDSAQPDARLAAILERIGCEVEHGEDWIRVRGGDGLAPFELDAGDCPDLVPTLAVLALFADGPCRIGGVAHLRLKESDRLEVLARNLVALGRSATASGDSLSVAAPTGRLRGGVISTSGDHRIAMAFAVAGLRIPGVAIDDAACVAKSNPGFWKDFAALERST